VGFEVIPAVDVSDGRLTRMGPAGPEPVDAFHGDPLAAAAAFLEAGAVWIHLVDVDRALTGVPRDLALLRRVAGLGARVQASGGIVSLDDAEGALEAGAARVVIGSGALSDLHGLERLLVAVGPEAVVGIEIRDGSIRPRGGEAVRLPLPATLERLARLPVRRLLCTAVARVGELTGPDLSGLRLVAEETGRPVIAAGGVRGPEDLRAVADAGLEGAVIGRALYEGLDLRRAREAVFTGGG
jgi:phosphoribosylformimino-5-aminoimidazole carboxamide ribonucleotide (ProFAR) isomerase